ncbi:hypothetical protein K503DRAFT_771981 [Rhizopogon vinicolor AM-OR11-026]|uniref:REM-1 domain-containing protein n=1 Tax=Rhizopogon vinicolor AM-OR11-026 TaxID=1314800 RepID=A0A1B7MWE8_9AGAM|nr:hypothetical protein K503DRAFT_773244 [Rhizopogon vinicolor AM-OR11-026]OAX36932.1 hypothetical protein K503DRAFT_771981 [Rhizopogon vinicolor AM-OR11-026]
MDFTPRHPQPFTFQQAISFDPEVSADEITRLQNSISHLKRTQEELKEYADDPDVAQAIKENSETLASQDERIFMLKLALSQHGASTNSTHYELPPDVESGNGRHDGFGSGGNGLEPMDAPHSSDHGPSSSAGEAEEEYGMHL